MAFCAQRVSQTVGAKWAEFDLTAGTWAIPRERMKRKDKERGPHEILLPTHLLATLHEWRKADGPDAVYVCPAPRDPAKPITPEAVEKHYRDALHLGSKHSPHRLARGIRDDRPRRRQGPRRRRSATRSRHRRQDSGRA